MQRIINCRRAFLFFLEPLNALTALNPLSNPDADALALLPPYRSNAAGASSTAAAAAASASASASAASPTPPPEKQLSRRASQTQRMGCADAAQHTPKGKRAETPSAEATSASLSRQTSHSDACADASESKRLLSETPRAWRGREASWSSVASFASCSSLTSEASVEGSTSAHSLRRGRGRRNRNTRVPRLAAATQVLTLLALLVQKSK
jgi:hypothetical protein